MYKEKLRESFKVYDEIVLKCFCGIFIGAIVAICEVIFGKGLEWILNFREHMGSIMLVGLPFAGYACQGFVILGYIDGEQPKSKPRKPGRIKIVE